MSAGAREPARRGARRIGFVLGPVLFALVLATPAPAQLSSEAWRVAAVALLMATWWVTEAIPIPATALLPLVLFPLLDVVPVAAAAAPFANPVIYLFMGGFLIAAALQRCGLHRRIALGIVRAGGGGAARLVGSFMAATAFISMWVSNTATVAMLLPMALSVLELAEDGAGPEAPAVHLAPALLLGLAYGANIGGLGTLIGTPPNALLAGFMSETYDVTIGFLEWMLVGVPLVVVSLPIAWLLLTRVLHPVGELRIAGGREALVAQARALGRLSRAEWTVGIVTALTAAAWLTQPLIARIAPGVSDAGIAIAGALLLFLLPVERSGARALDWEAAERLPWGVLVLFGGGLSLANGIQETGLASWIGTAMAGIGTWPAILVVIGVTTVIVFLTELTSNTATAAAFLPVVSSLAVAIGASPLLLAVPTALGASCAFMMPVATPPNAIVFGSGRLTIPQMMRAGIWLNLVFIVLITAVAVWLAPRVLGGP
ncbi:MAG TPA: DASS family sodium-coupled anion symporter [Gemmatimonadaceae bacterium]|nr:DASS family sodium-coupled anion symporter [Gemmatimonadaceae bacterium]